MELLFHPRFEFDLLKCSVICHLAILSLRGDQVIKRTGKVSFKCTRAPRHLIYGASILHLQQGGEQYWDYK